MRTVTVSHNWYSFLQCLGIAVLTVFGVPSDISCWDWGRVCRAWLGLVGMKAELGHSLTSTFPPSQKNIRHLARKYVNGLGERTWSRIPTAECSKVMAAVRIV